MTSQFRLAKTLGPMGMTAAFYPGKADFSGMTAIATCSSPPWSTRHTSR